MERKPIYILGHQNPDADSICAAIAYAEFKKAMGEEGYVAARCGNSNARIDAILKAFDQPLPVFIGDLTPSVRDIMVEEVREAYLGQTCSEVLELIDRHDVRTVPVLNPERKLMGAMSIFQLGQYFTPRASNPRKMRHVHTSIEAMVRSLQAEVLHAERQDQVQDFYVRVGAMDIRSFNQLTLDQPIRPEESIIVVGDRWDIQEKSIQMGVRLLVIAGGLQVDPEVLERAKRSGVSLIISPFDSATTSWIIRTAGFIDDLVEPKCMKFRPETTVKEARRKISDRYAPLYFVVDDEEHLLGVFSKTDILRPSSIQVVLVDHNELSQSVRGAEQVRILEIIDHHRLGNIPTEQPILFINRPVGSTCTIIADLFRKEQLPPTPSIAGIMMSGIISDTLMLNSPTTTEVDREILSWLEGLAGVEAPQLADRIFNSGSLIQTLSAPELVRADCKTYEERGTRFAVAQIEELGFDSFWDKSEAIGDALADMRLSEGLFFAALLVTDIHSQNSLFLVTGEESLLEEITYPKVGRGNVFNLPGVVSRKKQLLPYLTNLLESVGVGEE